MPKQKTLRLILGDQLNENHTWFKQTDKNVTYVLMEIRQETDYVAHHIQKVAAFFAAMRAFAERLRELGHRVVYLKLDDPQNRQTIAGNIIELLHQKKFTHFEYLLPDEYRLDVQLGNLEKELRAPVAAKDTEHFLTERQELKKFFTGKKRYLMESFYRWMRKRCDILMDKDKPVGGQWNYDQKNRQAYDHQVPIPQPLLFANDVSNIVRTLRRKKVVTIGEIQPANLIWPITRDQSLALLKSFVDNFLPAFGTYQDAMTGANWHLFHCRLSFAMNTKMLHPLEVIKASIKAWEKKPSKIEIRQIEGFVRQILGWREYMRGIYWALMPDLAAMNYFDHQAALPDFYWTGDTRMNCLRAASGQSLKHAYAHHIQRLMVTGNFALLAGVHPDAVDEWYLGIYIDAIQWVELPNTRAMSQFADGGQVATKPYISSAKYIRSMSDYCDDCSYDWKKRHGHMACPFNSLYWDFIARHQKQLQKNPRVAMMYRTWHRMGNREQKDVLKQAKAYKKDLNRL
ncbi:MAG: cryptochrome/photolyase family protein [Deltaproteobacteria bacterium]|nr:MAG: cryptochrome/photolyase family protein [Deltaproteobacteria bacterium]